MHFKLWVVWQSPAFFTARIRTGKLLRRFWKRSTSDFMISNSMVRAPRSPSAEPPTRLSWKRCSTRSPSWRSWNLMWTFSKIFSEVSQPVFEQWKMPVIATPLAFQFRQFFMFVHCVKTIFSIETIFWKLSTFELYFQKQKTVCLYLN